MNSYLKIQNCLESDFETIKSTQLTKSEKEMLLCFACSKNRKDVIIFLCEETDVDIHHNNDSIFFAAEHFEMIDFLISFDSEWAPSCYDFHICRAAKYDTKWLKYFIEERKLPFEGIRVQNAFLFAAISDNIASAEYISSIRDVDFDDLQIRSMVSAVNSFKIADFLLKKGVDKQKFTKKILDLVNFYHKRQIRAVNKIGTWWIPFCYDLNRESGQRMMWNSWRRVEKEMNDKFGF